MKWRWNENCYGTILKLCVGLTNIHVKENPLRANDLTFNKSVKTRLYTIGESSVQKRKDTQKRYRERRKRRVNLQVGTAVGPTAGPSEDSSPTPNVQ